MADPNDLLSSEGLDSGTPVAGLDLLPEGPGPLKQGFGAGMAGVKSNLAGAGALAAHAVGATSLEKTALDYAAEQNQVAAEGARGVEDVDWTSPSSVVGHVKYLLGQALPSLALMFTGGAAGRGFGALATRSASAATRAAVTEAAMFGGAVAPDVALEAGGIYPDALKTGVEDPALRATVGGAAAASLDFVPLLAAERWLKRAGRGGFGAMLRGAAKGAPVGAALEGTQELGQAVIERAAAGQDLTGPEAMSDYLNSFAGGAAPGAIFGAGTGVVHSMAAPKAATVRPTVQPAAATPVAEPVQEPVQRALSPEDQADLEHANLVTTHDAAAAQAVGLEKQIAAAGATQAKAAARLAELKVEEAKPLGERRPKNEIIAERKALNKAAAAARSGLEGLGGQLKAARDTMAEAAPKIAAHESRLATAAAQAKVDATLAVREEIKAKEAAPASEVIATGPAETPAEQVDRAVKGVHAIFREQGMPLTTTRESLETPPLGRREAALAKAAEENAPRERVKGPSRAQMEAVEPHAMAVIEPMARSLADAKGKTPEAKAKIAASLTGAMRDVVQEAAKKLTVAEAQAHIVNQLPARLKGHGVQADAEDIAKAVSVAVGQAKTLYSKGAVDRPGVIAKLKALRAQITPLAEKGNLTLAESKRYREVIAQIVELRFSIASPATAADAAPGTDRKSALSPETNAIAHNDGLKNKAIHMALMDAAAGAQFNADTAIDEIMRGKNKHVTAQELYRAFEDTRAALTRQFGPALTLFRAIGRQKNKPTTNWATTREFASQFGADVVEKQIPVTDVIAVNVSKKGLYHEIIVGTPPAGMQSNAALTQDQFEALPERGQSRVMAEYNAIMARKGRELTDRLRALIGDDPDLMVTTFQAKPGDPIGSYTRVDKFKSIIALALNAKEDLSVADHEGFHYAEERLLDARERAVVREALRAGKPLHAQLMALVRQYDVENKTAIADEVEGSELEAHAYAFEFWRRGAFKPEGLINQVFEKIAAVLRAIVRHVTGAGFTTMEDIFTALDRGQFAERARADGPLLGPITYANAFVSPDGTPMLSQAGEAKWYRSALLDQVSALPMKSGTAQSWQAELKGLVAKGAVKQAEIEAVGLEEWLKVQGEADQANAAAKASQEELAKGRPYRAVGEEVRDKNGKVVDVYEGPGGASYANIRAQNMNVPLGPFKAAKISRDEVVSFLKQHGVRVEEVVLGEKSSMPPTIEELDEVAFRQFDRAYNDLDGDEQADLRESHFGEDEATGAAKYADYQLPGGTDYREVLLKLPESEVTPLVNVRELTREEIDANATIRGTPGPWWGVIDDNGRPLNGAWQSEGRAQQVLQEARQSGSRPLTGRRGGEIKFASTHFGEHGKNLLAHVRLNSRTDATGAKVLFLEEIQSDWAQQGQKQGFKDPAIQKRIDALDKERLAIEDDRILNNLQDRDASPEVIARWTHIMHETRKLTAQRDKGLAPAPFVQKTEAWTALVLKRMVRYAVEHGMDRIAWTTGAQQVEQYTSALRKHVDAIEWTKTKDGVHLVGYKGHGGGTQEAFRDRIHTFDVQIDRILADRNLGDLPPAEFQEVVDLRTRRGNLVRSHGMANPRVKVVDTTEKETALSDAIGKSMAQKILTDSAQSGTIEGENIKVDDTGMAAFYDRIVPNVANDVLRKLDKSVRVEQIQTSTEHGDGSDGRFERDVLPNLTAAERAEANRLVNNMPAGQGLSWDSATRRVAPRLFIREQPGFTITPAMVQKAMAGLPLFSRGAVDSTRDGLGDVLTTPAIRTAYSRAAIAAQSDMAALEAEGELVQQQAFQAFARMQEQAMAHGSDNLGKLAYGAVKTQVSGGLSRWWQKNIATPNYISRLSNGYKNVFNVLNTYVRYRNDLVERMLIQRIPLWYKASNADQDAAFAALNERNLKGYTADSQEFRALVYGLTPKQQEMFRSATKMFEGFLQEEFAADQPFMRKTLITPGEYEKWFANRSAQVTELIAKGYMPLRRYGDHTVHVYMDMVKPDGTPYKQSAGLEFFGSARGAYAASKLYEQEIARSGAQLKVEVGTHYKAARDTTISAQQFIDTARRNGVAFTAQETERLVKALSSADSLVRNRMLQREGMPGYSKDGMRVMNEFGMRMAGKLAYSRFASAIDAAAAGRKVDSDVINGALTIKTDSVRAEDESPQDFAARNLWTTEGPMSGFHHNLADELTDYVLVPDHTGQWSRKLRGAAMMYFIGGSLSSALVNTMSVPMMVVPELSMHTDYANAAATTLSAWTTTWRYQHILRDIERLKSDAPEDAIPGIDRGLRQALVAAAQYTLDTELHQIMGISQGQLFSQSQGVQRAMKAWMAPFQVSEQTNRIASFIAAYRIASTEGVRQPDGSFRRLSGPALFSFARGIIDATQNNYNETNRPGAARNPVYALMFMFKSFPLFMTEAIALMYKANPRSAVYALLGLTAMTGVQGLPFAEAIEDLIDTIAQQLFNSPFNTRRAMRNVIKQASDALIGYDASDLVLRGVINSVLGVSASSRIGAGDFVPGSRLGTADADQGRVLEQMLGAPYAMVKDSLANLGKLAGGVATLDWKQAADALREGGPVAVRNAIKGVEQLANGYASDSKGRKLIDVTGLDAILQMSGMSSAGLAKGYEFEKINHQVKAFYTQVSADMQHQLVKAMRAGDTAKVQEVMDLRNAWNARYPEMPILASPSAVRRDLALSGLPMDRRSQLLWSRRIRGENMFSQP